MPIIYSYPTITPTTGDLLILSDVSAAGKPTKTTTIGEVFDLLGDAGGGDWDIYRKTIIQNDFVVGALATGRTAEFIGDLKVKQPTATGKRVTIGDAVNDMDTLVYGDVETSGTGKGFKGDKATIKEIAANGSDVKVSGIPGTVGTGKTLHSKDINGNIEWQPGVQTVEVTLSPTNLLNLHTTPILLLATPSPVANISILGAWFFLTWAGPAYNAEEIVIEDTVYGTTIYSTVNTPVASTFQGGRTMPISRTLPTGNINWTTGGIQISTTGSLGAGGSSVTISIAYLLFC